MPKPDSRPSARPREDDRVSGAEAVTTARKVAFLSRADNYPERTDAVEVLETRHSWVFLTAVGAWKLKKPERSDLFDFTTVEARRRDCVEEVRLNAPLAPGVYQGVAALVLQPRGDLALGDDDGTVVDHLVHMRRLPGDECLEARIAAGEIPPGSTLDRAADRLAFFYREAPNAGPVDVRALREAIAAESAALQDLPLPAPDEGDWLRDGLLRWIDRHSARLSRRCRIEVHGDLRPQHIYLTDPPVFIDRLTFARELRLLDAAEELAFLALECERLGVGWIGERFLYRYAQATSDDLAPDLVAFYRARRGLLWALLSGRHLDRSGRTERPSTGNERPWAEIATAYRQLALAWLREA